MIDHHITTTTTTTNEQSNHTTNAITKRRPRSTTISATTVDADSPLRRQQWVQQLYNCIDDEQKKLDQQEQPLIDSYIMDEKLGRTRPPRWWLLTKKHLTRTNHLDHENNDSSSSLPKKLIESINLPSSSIPTSSSPTSHSSSTTTSSSMSNNHHNNHNNNSTNHITKITNHLTFSSVLPSSNLKSSDLVSPKNKSIEELNEESKTLKTKKIIPMIKSLSTSTTHSTSSSHPSQENNHTTPISLKNVISNQQNENRKEVETNHNIIPSSSNHHDIKRKRTLNKIKSVFVKSQIEPELSRQQQTDLTPKRKTILGIPSRWKHSTLLTSQELLPNNDTTTSLIQSSTTTTMENKQDEKKEIKTVRMNEKATIVMDDNDDDNKNDDHYPPTMSKKHVFHSLPIWKRKSYR
ncbi:unnamed protein product [Cunninghamella blakesleeana]